MLLPSSIHRAEDFVGIAMPTVPLLWAKAPVTAAAAMVAASTTADNVVFRLVMLHSLEDLWFLDRQTAECGSWNSVAPARLAAAPRLPPSIRCKSYVWFGATTRSDIEHEGAAMIGIGAL